MATEVQWLSELEQDAWQAIRLLGQPVYSALNSDLFNKMKLTMADYQVMVTLARSETRSLHMQDLLEYTEWSKSRLSHQVRRMEERGLVARSACLDDKRSIVIELSDYGYSKLVEAAPQHVSAVRRLIIDRISEEEMRSLISIAQSVRMGIAEESSPAAHAEY